MSTQPKPSSPSFIDRLQQGVFIALMALMLVAVLLTCIALAFLYLRDQHEGERDLAHAPGRIAVTATVPAGRVLAVTLSQGLFTRSLVQTDLGFYALVKGVSLERDKPLTLEQRSNSERYLCDDQHRCTRLL